MNVELAQLLADDAPTAPEKPLEREARRLPLDQVLAQVRADAAEAPGTYLAETEVPDGGE